jgi:heme-binding NEAT domain protein
LTSKKQGNAIEPTKEPHEELSNQGSTRSNNDQEESTRHSGRQPASLLSSLSLTDDFKFMKGRSSVDEKRLTRQKNNKQKCVLRQFEEVCCFDLFVFRAFKLVLTNKIWIKIVLLLACSNPRKRHRQEMSVPGTIASMTYEYNLHAWH